MIDVNELNDEVRESILNNQFGADRDEEDFDRECNELFTSMSVEEAFEFYCSWHGLLGWSGRLIQTLDNIRSAAK